MDADPRSSSSTRSSAPKEQQDSAQGFNPGSCVFCRCALKGHPKMRRGRPHRRSAILGVTAPNSGATREALRSRPRRRPRPRIRPRGVMEYWSVGVLRQFGIAPRVRGVGTAFRARRWETPNPGLKPWAESLCPFGAGRNLQSTTPTFHNAVTPTLRYSITPPLPPHDH
jgi:hypothetical protein